MLNVGLKKNKDNIKINSIKFTCSILLKSTTYKFIPYLWYETFFRVLFGTYVIQAVKM